MADITLYLNYKLYTYGRTGPHLAAGLLAYTSPLYTGKHVRRCEQMSKGQD
jgi:hypothetical protein